MGNAFKKAFEDFEIDPNVDLWQNIHEKNIELGNAQKYPNFYKIVASVAVFTLISVAAYMMYSTESNSDISSIANEILPNNIQIKETNTLAVDSQEAPNNSLEKKDVFNIENSQKQNIIVVEHKKIEKHKKNISVVGNDDKKNSIVKVEIDNKRNRKEIIQTDVAKDNMQSNSRKDTHYIANNELLENDDTVEIENDSFKVKFGGDKLVCFGEDAILEVEEGYSYYWSNGLVSSKIKVSPTENSIYSVTVTNLQGQTQKHEYSVDIDRGCSALFIPTAFTPNFDGQNDVFKSEGNGILSMKMFVFDKFGTKVFEANSVDDEWDGMYRGRMLDEGMFFYKAEYTDALGYSHVKNGQLTLIK